MATVRRLKGVIRKKDSKKESKGLKIQDLKIFSYLKTLWHILLRIQPFFSIFLALIVSLPLTFGVIKGIESLIYNSPDNIYYEGVIGNISYIDPLPVLTTGKNLSQINRDVTRLLFDPLFSTDPSGNLLPVMAESYTAQNNLTEYVVKLRDRTWSDGRKFTANDVVTTFKMIKDLGPSGLYYAGIDDVNIKKIDDLTVVFSFDSKISNSAFLETLNWPVLPASEFVKKYDESLSEKFGTHPVSSTNWGIETINEQFIQVTNSKINKKIRFVFYNNNSELKRALNSGFINGYYSLELPDNNQYTTVNKYILPRQVYSLYFNLSDSNPNPYVKDPVIRKAISYAINRTELAGDSGIVRQSIYDSNSWAYNPAVNTYQFDLSKAEKTLEDAGYKKDIDGYRKSNSKTIEFTLYIPDLPVRNKQAEKIQTALKTIGIKMNINKTKDTQLVDSQLKTNIFYNSIVITKSFDAMIFSIDAGLDPDKFSQWHSSRIPDINNSDPQKRNAGLNFAGYSGLKADVYLRQGRGKQDPKDRTPIYFAFQKVFYEDPPVVTLYNPYVFYVTSNKVSNIDFSQSVRIEDRFNKFDLWRY